MLLIGPLDLATLLHIRVQSSSSLRVQKFVSSLGVIDDEVERDEWWYHVPKLSLHSAVCVEDCGVHCAGKGALSVCGQGIRRDALLRL